MDNHAHGPKCGCQEYLYNENADDLLNSIDKDAMECLNEAILGSCKEVFRPIEEKLTKIHYIESEVDGEFIVIVPFIETVRVKSINVIAYDEGSAPDMMRAYVNRENIDFDLVTQECAQAFQISANLSGDYGCAVKQSVFENVNKLVLHFRSQHNDPIRVSYIGIKGVRTEQKRQMVNTMYQLIAMPKEGDPLKDTNIQNVF